MKKLLRKVYNKCIKQFLPMSLRQKLKSVGAQDYSIITNPEEAYEKIYHIKDATWEKAIMPDVYHLSKEWEMAQYHESQDIILIKNCTIGHNSDVVITENGAFWEKAYADLFSKIIPLDVDVLKYNRECVQIRKPITTVEVQGECISMLGVHATIWSHFMVQYLPKLYYAEKAGLLDKEMTIILPTYKDEQVNTLVDDVLRNHPKVKRFVLPEDAYLYRVHCEALYYVPISSKISNNAEWLSPYDIVIPQCVLDIIKEKVIKPYQALAIKKEQEHDKIFLVRHSWRGLANNEEIEQYFKEQGFAMVEPHLLSLEDKVNLFYHAKIIIGPHSSAWSNVMFCKNAKGLMFSPLCRTLDAYAGYLNKYRNIDWMLVTGDDSSATIHSDYGIPTEKIIAAYKQLINK